MPGEADTVADAFGVGLESGPVRLHPEDRGGLRRRRADVAGRANRDVEHVVRSEGNELPGMALIRIRQVVEDGDWLGRCVEVLLDVVEAEDLARGGHVQCAVPHRNAIGLAQAAGDGQDLIGLVIAVAVDDRVDVAHVLGPDEHRALRAERHHAGVADVLGEDLEFEPRRNDQRTERSWRPTLG